MMMAGAIALADTANNHLWAGPTSCGKTTGMTRWKKRFKREIRVDPNGEKSLQAGAVIVSTFDDLRNAARDTKRGRRDLICFTGYKYENPLAFDMAVDVARRETGFTVVGDEGERLFPRGKLSAHANWIISMGRKADVDLFYSALYLTHVNPIFRQNAPHMHFYGFGSGGYRAHVAKECDRAAVAVLETMPEYAHIYRAPNGRWRLVKKNKNS